MTNNEKNMINDDFIKKHSLLECLQEFKGAKKHGELNRLDSVAEEFKALAKKFLYGGRFKVGGYFDIIIDNVEFYYHEEEQLHPADELILDTIVYHRNEKLIKLTKNPNSKYPPFPLMTLHAHQSGIDITFEDHKGRYRASALIREYSVIDHYNNDSRADDRSQYLYDYLNGFSLNGEANYISWEDDNNYTPGPIYVGHRKNVFKDEYNQRVLETKKRVDPNKNNEQRIAELDGRLWAFSKREFVVRHYNGAKETYQKVS